MTKPAIRYIDRTYDIVIIGGGIGGTIAAITASRKGLKTALIDNKPGLGGNANSDIGVSIDGAPFFGFFANMREGGPVEEMKEMLAEIDPFFRNTQTSGILLFWCEREKVDVYSELNIFGVEADGRRIKAVTGTQGGTERNYRFSAGQFVDATGDGTVAALAGCDFMQGREAKNKFNEVLAPDKADQGIMGASLLYRASEKNIPTVFRRPEWAYEYKTADDLPFRLASKGPQPMGHWWIEYAGDKNDPIGEYESIRRELLKCVYGVWSYFKNDPERGMEKYALDSVTIAPAKRESRRIVGDYILTERDITARRHFDDAVAYEVWNIDIHVTC
ncbi:MAG: FAD-dependent oxidoreductase [Spirochaetota bacterium]